MKKIISLFLIIIVTISMSACEAQVAPEIKPQTPQEFLEGMYTDMVKPTTTFGKIYDKYLSDVSKKVISKDNFIKAQDQDLTKNDIIINSFNAEKIAEFENGITEFKCTLTYAIDDVTTTKVFDDFVIEIDGEFKYLYQGILSKKIYTMQTTDPSNKIHCKSATIYEKNNAIQLELNMENSSISNMTFGWNSGSEVKIVTSQGEYSAKVASPCKINSESEVSIAVIFDGAKGDVNKITVLNIYSLNIMSEPIESGTGLTYTVNIK